MPTIKQMLDQAEAASVYGDVDDFIREIDASAREVTGRSKSIWPQHGSALLWVFRLWRRKHKRIGRKMRAKR